MIKIIKMLLSFCLASLSFFTAFSKTSAPFTNQYDSLNIKHYSIKDGLPSKNTTATLKDSRGFIWVGTENGLCRFDGYNFKTFQSKSGDNSSISNNYINALCEDKNGQIWVATMDGLNLLNPLSETFKRFFHDEEKPGSLSNDKIWSILCDKAGKVWIGTDDGFNEYRPDKNKFIKYRPDSSTQGSIVGKSVNAIIEDKHGNIWLGNWSGGLNKFDKKKKTFTNYLQYHAPGEKNPNDIWSLSYGSDGSIWVGTYWDGLFNFRPETGKFSKVNGAAQKRYSVFSITTAPQSLVVGTGEGFYFYNTLSKQWRKIDNLLNNAYGDSYIDNDGIIWLNARNGFYKINAQKHKFNLKRFNINNRGVTTMVTTKSILWIGTTSGLFKIDKQTGSVITFFRKDLSNSLNSDNIGKLYLDSSGILWILTEDGFDSFNERDNRFEHHSHHSKIGSLFNEDVFRDILEIEKGIYMMATDAGVKIYNSKTKEFQHFYNQANNPQSINNNHTYYLCKAPDGQIWIGTYGGGINVFNRASATFKSITTANGLSNNVINAIFTDSRKNIWVCTPDGLDRFNPSGKHLHSYSTIDGFSSNRFNGVTEDRNGKIWVVTENGLSSLDYQNAKVMNFDETDGVQVNSVISRFNNSIIVAGNNGYFSFDPDQIKLNREMFPVFITDFQLFNKTVQPSPSGPLKENLNTAKQIILSYNQSVFSIEFAAVNFINPLKIAYAYKLEGFDKKWNEVGNQRKATYTNLNPGKYLFQVRSTNNDGVWSNKIIQIAIIINPPWYLSWWAYLFYAIAGATMIYLYLTYQKNQEKLKYEIKIAHIEFEKEKELNEKKLSFFTNMSHEFRTPLTLIINPVKDLLYRDDKNLDTNSMNVVYRNAKRLLSLVDQLLLFRKADANADTLKVSKLNIVEIAKEVYLCFAHQAKNNSISYYFISSAEVIEVYGDREKLEIAIFNLLSNAFKFTPESGRIGVKIVESDAEINLVVEDSGRGITKEAQQKIFNRFYQGHDKNGELISGFGIGLFLVKNFVEMHGGSIECESEQSSGTSFTIHLLKGSGHINPDSIFFEDSKKSSLFLNELSPEALTVSEDKQEQPVSDALLEEKKSILIIDDNQEIANYLREMFDKRYHVYQASDGESGLAIVREFLPDVVISDVMMAGMGGIELCSIIKEDEAISHIPVILLTASSSAEIKLKGVESGADDYISKPFDKELLIARIASILKSKNSLQKYFYNEITLNPSNSKISSEYKDFLKNCIKIVEDNFHDPNFSIKVLAEQMGMSRENLYKKIKSISGHSSNSFIRFIRLRKAAEIFITTDKTVRQTVYMVGMSDVKYFREQFNKLFNMNPSDYIKKHRKTFSNNLLLNKDFKKDH